MRHEIWGFWVSQWGVGGGRAVTQTHKPTTNKPVYV
jgi:hypothetical protein